MFATSMLFLVLIFLLLYLGSRKPKGYPPGPKWWPILGCAYQLARIRKETGYLYKTLATFKDKYGSIVGLKIGHDRIVVLNDYESMRSMLTNEDCDGRPIGPMWEARTWGARRGLIAVDGRLWIEQRRFILRHLRDFGFGRNTMATIIEEEAIHLVQHFKNLLENSCDDKVQNVYSNNNNNNGLIYKLQLKNDPKKYKISNKNPLGVEDMYMKAEDYIEVRRVSRSTGIIVPMHNAFGITVFNTLWKMMAGKRFNTGDRELTYFQRILTQILRDIDMIGAPFSHFPVLKYIAPRWSGYTSFIDLHQEIWKFLKNELENHKRTVKLNEPRDLMDAYLKVLMSDDEHSETFSDSQLLAICIDLFMAGSETTSNALSFCIQYFLLFPNVQKKAQEEIDRVIGHDRFPTLADRPNMPYLNAIVLESLRMFMGRTLNIPHRALRDTNLKGYRIPKDTIIVANLNRVLMDESWGDPDDFRPERFIDEKGSIVIPDRFIPFSYGRHRCMGEVLGKSNIFVIIGALVQSFTFSLAPGEDKPTGDSIDGVTACPKPFKALVSLRK